MKRIWNWFTARLDSRLATSVAVGAFTGLAVFGLTMLGFVLTRGC